MLRIIKLGDFVYENIEPILVDEEGNQIWQVPQDLDRLRSAFQDTLLYLASRRLKRICEQYGYYGLGDIRLYTEQGDPEAQALLSWYIAYDDAVWQWIEQELPKFQTVDDLLAVNLQDVEENIFRQQSAHLP